MKAIEFEQQNGVVRAPEQTEEQIERSGKFQDLPVHFNRINGHMMSIWYPSDEDREIIAKGGAIALFVYGGQHPPVFISTADMDYKPEQTEEEVVEMHAGDNPQT